MKLVSFRQSHLPLERLALFAVALRFLNLRFPAGKCHAFRFHFVFHI